MTNPIEMGNYIWDFFDEFDSDSLDGESDALIQPFGLLYHSVTTIDSNYLNSSSFSAEQFHLTPQVEESNIYKNCIYKSASLFEFYPESGYENGFLKFDPKFISSSPEITNLTIKLNVGRGFEVFDAQHPFLKYNRAEDSIVGKAAIEFQKSGTLKKDTLLFYLTTKGNGIPTKSGVERWDFTYKVEAPNGVKMRVMVRKGCGNPHINNDIGRRPIIIAPPYRPGIQPFSPDKYWDQFDYKSVMSSLSDMGYDIFFIKFRKGYGHESLEKNGEAVAWYIDQTNIRKEIGFPNESNENIVMGYSMGGQVTRYALQKLEKDHMENGGRHHHSRLYAPFDSPHHSVNIPLFAQAVYYDYGSGATFPPNIFAILAYLSLVDEASKDMCYYHWLGSTKQDYGNGDIRITPLPATERTNFQNTVHNSFLHQLSFPSDERRAFPAFTRNISISTGNVDKDYNSEYTLTPGKLLFEQDALVVGMGLQYKKRRMYASKFGSLNNCYSNEVWTYFVFFVLKTHNVNYRTKNALEWDMASGGYKDHFYDKWEFGFLPIGPVPILRITANFWGHKHYGGHMSFLPTTSALAIKPSIWQTNNLFYDLKENGLMYKKFNFNPNIDKSNTYGYPNLGRPADHFNITPL